MRPSPEPVESKTSALPGTADRTGLIEPLCLVPGAVLEGHSLRGAGQTLTVVPDEASIVAMLRTPHTVEELHRENLRSPTGVAPAVIVRVLLRLQEAGLLAGDPGRLNVPIPGGRLLAHVLGLFPRVTWLWGPALLVALAVVVVLAWAREPTAVVPPSSLGSWEVLGISVLLPLGVLLLRAFVRGVAAQSVGVPGAAASVRLRWRAGAELTDPNLTPVERFRARAVASAGLGAVALPLVCVAMALAVAPSGPLTAALSLAMWLLTLLFLVATAPMLPTDARTVANLSRSTPVLGRDARAWLAGRSLLNLLRFRPMSPLEEGYARVATLMTGHALVSWLVTTRCLLPVALKLVTRAMRVGDSSVAAAPLLLASVWLLALTWGLLGVLIGFVRPLWRLARVPKRVDSGARATLEPGQVHVVRRGAWQLPFFAKLGQAAVDNLPSLMRNEEFVDGQTILRQGDAGDRICCLTTGSAMVEVEDAAGLRHPVAKLNHADFFGETAILANTPRTAHVIADGRTVIASMDRQTFLDLVAQSGVDHDEVLRQVRVTAALRGHPLFVGLSAPLLTLLVQTTQWLLCPQGTVLVEEGDNNRDLYLILEGQCAVSHGTAQVGELGPLDWFGELALLTDGPRQASVTARTDVSLLRVPQKTALATLAQDPVPTQRLWHVAAERLQTAREAQ